MTDKAKRRHRSSSIHNAALNAGLRELRDPRDMRALAHPTRLALLEALAIHGPMTATQASEVVGESPSSCSFHLRSLAQHGFAEETGEGRGRERPWRCVAEGTSMSEPYEDVPTKAAARALSEMYFDRYISRLRQARAHFDDLDPEWRAHQADVESLIWVTPEELGELNEAILALALKYRDRLTDPARRPIGARPVELLYFAHNAELTSLGGKAEPADQPSNRSSKAAKPRSKTAR